MTKQDKQTFARQLREMRELLRVQRELLTAAGAMARAGDEKFASEMLRVVARRAERVRAMASANSVVVGAA